MERNCGGPAGVLINPLRGKWPPEILAENFWKPRHFV
jgi:hypothetical protein